MPLEIHVRQAQLEDAVAIAAMLSDLNAVVGVMGVPEPDCFLPENAYISPETMRERMLRVRGIETLYVAEVGDQPAGFTSLRLVPYLDQDTPYAEITQMYVRSEFRRNGVGAALIKAAEHAAGVAGATCVHLYTGLDNPNARAFYGACGYREINVEIEKWFDGDAR